MTTTETAAATAKQAIAHLEALSAEIDKHGWITRLTAETNRTPCLFVQNPEPGAAALNDHICAAPKAGGWWSWWSWAEPIAQDATATATTICRTLRTADRKESPA
jgi:hypothetical protein